MRMFPKRRALLPVIALTVGLAQIALAGDLKLTLPRRSQLTAVQSLNREGVEAIRRQHYEKAETLFYKAYLFDPGDPFTLYNLGYVSELQGQLERAQKFYGLASQQATDAVIDRTSAKRMEGKPMREAFGGLTDVPMQVNRMNIEAMRLLSERRAPEAELLLQKALALDDRNTFTMNNMGVAKESRGDFEDALKYYTAAADAHSADPALVTMDRAWRGKPVSEMAAESARKLRKRMQDAATAKAQSALLATRGVAAMNRNDWPAARQDFLDAYALDSSSAFSLNNLGYLSERDGDLESAQFFYTRAGKAANARDRVGLATRSTAEGMKLSALTADSDQKVDGKIAQQNQAKRRKSGPIQLKHRDNSPVLESAPTPAAPPSTVVPSPPTSQPPQ